MPRYFSTFRETSDESSETVVIHSNLIEHNSRSRFVLVKEEETYTPILNLDIGSQSFCFQDTQVINDTVLIGWGDYFATFNLVTRKQTFHSLDGYFGNFRVFDNKVFVCSAEDVTCLSIEGEVIWKSEPIAIDGVVINSFENETIYCSCEWDPPGGWQPFQLDFLTGKTKKGIS
ncbi:MAG: hypothetical protein JNM88_16380 [Chitinophagaceae bacterium]|nr:hypothetical protein [Chitinophagaceae bacterium]